VRGVAAVEARAVAHGRVAVLEQLRALLAQIVRAELALAARVRYREGGPVASFQTERGRVSLVVNYFNACFMAQHTKLIEFF
jgi:hypothetical protein